MDAHYKEDCDDIYEKMHLDTLEQYIDGILEYKEWYNGDTISECIMHAERSKGLPWDYGKYFHG